MSSQYLFGWWPDEVSVADHEFELRPMDRFDKGIEIVKKDRCFGDRWISTPIQDGQTSPAPVGRYELPCTHVLETKQRSYDPVLGEFLVLMLGFFLGMRFTLKGTGHLWDTPSTTGVLVGFVPHEKSLPRCLGFAASAWDNGNSEIRKLLYGAVHWYLVSQSYRHQFEQFSWQYIVMDNLYRVSLKKNLNIPEAKSHAERILFLHKAYQSPVPKSFGAGASSVGAIKNIRNELVHEGRWYGEPLGYAATAEGHDILQELIHFNSQIILGILNVKTTYRTMEYTRSVHLLDIK